MLNQRVSTAAGVLVVCLGGLMLGGCTGKVVDLGKDKEQLDDLIAKSNQKPVMVDFWKFGCASCMSLEPVMDKLAGEYDGRVIVARYQMEYLWFQPTNWEVFKRYGFAFFPTVILFIDGKEQHRWIWNLDDDAYRLVLDPLVPPPPPSAETPASTATPTTAPAAGVGAG
ncbi:MAG: hypothetical protein BIFFINMI_00294 [Phycisphaerae bacterium]|nr:hypothetical protein [Phycisphaerae bacterium]